jgi:hypothetical protein
VTTFEYLAVLFSVVVGLAVAQTLQGLLRMVRHWRTTRFYWPALIWTAAVMQWAIIFWWFSASGLGGLTEWQLPGLLFVLAYGSALFFLLGLLYPDDMGSDFDMRAHFREVRPWFFGIFMGLGFLEVTDTYLKLIQGTSVLGEQGGGVYLGFMAIWIGGAAVGLRTRDDRIVSGIGILFLIASLYVAYVYGWTMGAQLDLR